MNNKKKVYWIIAFVIVCILAFILVLTQLIKVNSECVRNPFTYAANTIIDNEKDVIDSVCYCDVDGVTGFYFDKEGTYKDNPILNP